MLLVATGIDCGWLLLPYYQGPSMPSSYAPRSMAENDGSFTQGRSTGMDGPSFIGKVGRMARDVAYKYML